MNIILAKLIISVASIAVLALIIAKRKYITEYFSRQEPLPVMGIGWVLFRLLPFIGLYLVVGMDTTSDVNGFWDEASKASMGQVVYRDFWSPYSPLYPYFLAAWLKLWYNSKMIVFVMAVMDGIALLLTWHFYRALLNKGDFLFKALLYFMFPGALMLCIIGAQEDVWMWLFVVLAYLVRERTLRVEWYAFILAIGLLMTKAIFVLILIPLFLLEKQKIRFAIPIVLVGIVTLGILYPLVGMEFMQPMDEAKVLRAPNILSVINPWFHNTIGVGEKFWNWIGLVISLSLASWAAFRLRTEDFRVMISRVWIVLYATMMIVQQSAYSNYIFLYLIPLVFYVIDWKQSKQVIALLIFNVLCVIHPSYWWRLGMVKYLEPNDLVQSSEHMIDYAMQVSIVLFTGYFIWLAFPKRSLIDR